MKKMAMTLVAASAVGLGVAGVAAPQASAVTVTTMTKAVKAGTTLNVRSGPGTSYARIGVLTGGTTVTGTVSNGWFHITSGPYAGGYVSDAYLTAGALPVFTGYVMPGDVDVNVRSGPGFGYPAVGTAKAHSKVTGTVSGDWVKIGTNRYVNKGTLSTAVPSTVNGRIPTSQLCAVPTAYNAPHSFEPGYTPKTVRYMNCTALKSLNDLEEAFKAHFGHYAMIDLTYRTYSEQLYWKRTKPDASATPGTSNHGFGLAVDFEEDDSPNGYSWYHPYNDWLLAHSEAYGFRNQFQKTHKAEEDYHFQFIG